MADTEYDDSPYAMREVFGERARIRQKERLSEEYERRRGRGEVEWSREREAAGHDCIDRARIWESPDGRITRISQPVGPAQPRLGLEGKFVAQKDEMTPSADRPQRLHGIGAGTGFESDQGIKWGERYVNQNLQNSRIEKHFRDRYEQEKDAPGERWLTTTVEAQGDRHSGDGHHELRRVTYTLERRAEGRRVGPDYTIDLQQNNVAQTGPYAGRKSIYVNVSSGKSESSEQIVYVENEPGKYVTEAKFRDQQRRQADFARPPETWSQTQDSEGNDLGQKEVSEPKTRHAGKKIDHVKNSPDAQGSEPDGPTKGKRR